tara:strand:+ start:12253 stop:12555 length:303 start_codon:yes stop_codon:yes gene_type:complete
MKETHITHSEISTRIVWRGIGIRVDYHPNRWNGPADHIELTSDNHALLPVTETGYHSNFVPAGRITPNTLVDYVLASLEKEALSEAWKAYEVASKQLSFF